MDETTDISVQKHLAIMVEFYDVGKSKTIVELLDLVQCEDGKAATILQNFLSLLKQMNIPTERYTLFVSKPCILLNLYLNFF